ncbi:glutathione S-transferase-like [Schistocerca piceifrons]|uniref:glutathione S-transferase-like n=1 Tax=Schistocerca piceifrons TaxID=274613 RepID=UPI001F5FA3D9|nr:glutathione S-transferase-like [Schistocerca piceifrons]XP_047108256.1 glutathione S-transferase-like [Schistocerca piceifrons]XP_047108258.1 glutathione S-transferase-like [Schistocerca piceifrons]XP_049947214.1 glutathione S-transferase-like [Schistocerca serialis cubense]
MAPKYKLFYFPIRVIAEPIRFILAYVGAEYEDIRVEWADWPSLKPDTPYGTLPVLEVDGKKLGQSIPICRYLAKQYGLLAENDWDNAQIDAAVDAIDDLRWSIKEFFFETNESRKKNLKEKLIKETVPFHYAKLEAMVKNNGGYLAGGKLTWGDLYFTTMQELFDHDLEFEITRDYPHLATLRNKVVNIPSIKSWIEKRPKTDR